MWLAENHWETTCNTQSVRSWWCWEHPRQEERKTRGETRCRLKIYRRRKEREKKIKITRSVLRQKDTHRHGWIWPFQTSAMSGMYTMLPLTQVLRELKRRRPGERKKRGRKRQNRCWRQRRCERFGFNTAAVKDNNYISNAPAYVVRQTRPIKQWSPVKLNKLHAALPLIVVGQTSNTLNEAGQMGSHCGGRKIYAQFYSKEA